MIARPLSITVISWLLIVVGCVTFAASWMPRGAETSASAPASRPREHNAAEFAMICAVRAAAAIAGVFMLRRHDWARWLALAWFAFHVAISGLHTPMKLVVHALLFIVAAYFLLRPRAWAYFGAGANAGESAG